MRRQTLAMLVVLLLLGSTPAKAWCCPFCADAVTQTTGVDEEDQTREAAAYNNSIYLLIGVPYALLTVFGVVLYRGLRSPGQNPS